MNLQLLFGLILSAALVAVAHGADGAASSEYVKVEIKGMLQTGVVAIGGETTGYVVTVDGAAWELDFNRHPELKTAADGLDKQTIIVTGIYYKKPGVERPDRNIVVVTTLAAAK